MEPAVRMTSLRALTVVRGGVVPSSGTVGTYSIPVAFPPSMMILETVDSTRRYIFGFLINCGRR